MKYAVIALAGKQYLVSEGQTFTVNKLDVEAGKTLTVSEVLLVSDGKSAKIGDPHVAKASVTLKVDSHQKGEKIRVATYKSKSRYRRVKGHRQSETTVTVTKIA